jgi:hypothetical protein
MRPRIRQVAAVAVCIAALGHGASAAFGVDAPTGRSGGPAFGSATGLTPNPTSPVSPTGAFVVDAPVTARSGGPSFGATTVQTPNPAGAPVDPRVEAQANPGGLVQVLDDMAARKRDLAARVTTLEASLRALETQQQSPADRVDQLLAQEKELAARLTSSPGGAPTAASDQSVALDRTREAQQELESAHLRAVTQGAVLAPAAALPALDTVRQNLAEARTQLAQVTSTLDAVARSEPLTPVGTQVVRPGPLATRDIPTDYLTLYQRAASTCPGLSWTVLAAIGSIESDHGRLALPGVASGKNVAGAMGPMQFLAETWAAYGVDGDGDGRADVFRAADAIFGAAKLLCASGAGQPARLRDAIWSYNHADWYVNRVIDLAIRYGSTGLDTTTSASTVGDVLANPRITLSANARADILSGTVDRRVIALLAAAATRHRIEVSVIRTGHDKFVRGTDRISDHFYARGVDIIAVDGAPVTATSRAAFDLAVEILTSSPSLRPDQLGSPWLELTTFQGAFSDDDHTDHLHLGWRDISVPAVPSAR